MSHWTPDDLPWDRFDPSRLDPKLLGVIKAAALVEHNAAHYTTYLCNVFSADGGFKSAAQAWSVEEVQHGVVLGRYAELADPNFSMAEAFQRFQAAYHIPVDREVSVRGSLTGELMARCMVEIGTSSFYTAMKEATTEPLLAEICRRIAADELRHYKLFYVHMGRYHQAESIGRWKRLWVALSRFQETEDDELATAWYCANEYGQSYERRRCSQAYARGVYSLYRPHLVDRAVAMMFKAAGFSPRGRISELVGRLAWRVLQAKSA